MIKGKRKEGRKGEKKREKGGNRERKIYKGKN